MPLIWSFGLVVPKSASIIVWRNVWFSRVVWSCWNQCVSDCSRTFCLFCSFTSLCAKTHVAVPNLRALPKSKMFLGRFANDHVFDLRGAWDVAPSLALQQCWPSTNRRQPQTALRGALSSGQVETGGPARSNLLGLLIAQTRKRCAQLGAGRWGREPKSHISSTLLILNMCFQRKLLILWDPEHSWDSFAQPLSSECQDACVKFEQRGRPAFRRFLQILQDLVQFPLIPSNPNTSTVATPNGPLGQIRTS